MKRDKMLLESGEEEEAKDIGKQPKTGDGKSAEGTDTKWADLKTKVEHW